MTAGSKEVITEVLSYDQIKELLLEFLKENASVSIHFMEMLSRTNIDYQNPHIRVAMMELFREGIIHFGGGYLQYIEPTEVSQEQSL
jgi:hypothetical protein